MMQIPPKEERELRQAIDDWVYYDENLNVCLRDDAPEEVKKKYKKWLEKYIIPLRDAPDNSLFDY